MIEDVFQTDRGTYQLDIATGLFTRKEGTSTPKYFLGSLDPNWTLKNFFPSQEVDMRVGDLIGIGVESLFQYIIRTGDTAGFTPLFREGHKPFGMVTNKSYLGRGFNTGDITAIDEGVLAFSDDFKAQQRDVEGCFLNTGLKLHLENPIIRVYRQLKPNERPYLLS